MRAILAAALVCLAVAGSGCDAVFGQLEVPSARITTFTAASQDSGAEPGGKVRTVVCCTSEFNDKVTCLRVEGNRATIGAEFGDPNNPVGHIWYLQDNPGEDTDRVVEDQADSPPTTCPAPPATFPQDSAVPGDIAIIDDFDG
jgi:hypothetical protein